MSPASYRAAPPRVGVSRLTTPGRPVQFPRLGRPAHAARLRGPPPGSAARRPGRRRGGRAGGPGRNLAVIVEAAAVNHRQKKMGYNAAKELYNRVQNSIMKNAGKQKEE